MKSYLEDLAGVFAGSRDAPRSFFAVETSKVSGKHLNLSENKNTSVAYSAINDQGVFNKRPRCL